MDVQQTFVNHGGFHTFVNSAGSQHEPTILFLHGSGPGAGGWSNWQFAVPHMKDRFFAIAPDLAGFGKSTAPKPYPTEITGWMNYWTDQAVSLLDHFGRAKAHLVGNSMGGAVALHLLARNPDRFDKVVLMGVVGVQVKLTRELDGIWGFYEHPSEGRMQEITRWFAYSDEVVNSFKNIGQARYEAAMNPEVRTAFSAMFPPPRQRHLDSIVVPDETIRQMSQPALIIHGRDDRIIPLQTSQHLLQTWGGPAQMHIFGRCGHWTQVEHKNSFNVLVRGFFEGQV
jgi:2-hydroxymuconate-semialdehyde hydrolase